MWWCSGSACIVADGSILWKIFISRPVECMNSYYIWIHIYDEFSMNSCIFCTLNIWIHTNMNSYYKYFLQFHVWIHIFLAVQNKSCERTRAASACRKRTAQDASTQGKPQARAASAQRTARDVSMQRKMRARSASRKGKAQAHFLPQPGRARLPRLLGLRSAAPIVRVVCGCPNSMGTHGCPNS
jgi:hypothetical protein